MSLIATRYGKFNIIDTDSIISGSLQLYGEWAQQEIDLLALFISPGSVVVDVGAFIGTHARAFSEFVGVTGKVLAFEPRQATGIYLIENAKLSVIGNIRVINAALGATEKTVTVQSQCIEIFDNFGALTLEPLEGKNDLAEKVAITTLDAYKLNRLDFIKIDVEGMELDVLNGARKTLEQCRPVIFAECNSLEAGMPLIKWCQANNYQAYGVLSPAYNQYNYAGNSKNIFGAAQETAMLLIATEFYSKFEDIIVKKKLPLIKIADDLVLLLLHKPQYPNEVLAHTTTASALSLEYSSPKADMLNQVAIDRQAELADLYQRLSKTELVKDSAEQLALERQAELVKLLERLTATEQAKDAAERMAIDRQAELDFIRTRVFWRIAEKLHITPVIEKKNNG